jgi:hypothetical protein
MIEILGIIDAGNYKRAIRLLHSWCIWTHVCCVDLPLPESAKGFPKIVYQVVAPSSTGE